MDIQILKQLMGGIFGNKKNSSKPLPPVSDTARSVAIGNVVEILCSGGNYGIEGFPTANIKESIYLEETPLSKDGVDFFNGATVGFRNGAPFQQSLDGFGNELVSETSVNAEIKPNLPITRSFVNENITAIKIRVSVVITKNKLKDGQVVQVIGDAIQFRIRLLQGSGNISTAPVVGDITVTGKFSEPFDALEYYFPVSGTSDEYTIRLERVTPADTENERRILTWASYSEVVEEVIGFKRMSFVGIRFDTEEFGTNFPERRYHIFGTRVDIPTNATINITDRGLDYDGSSWNGLFKQSAIACSDLFAIVWYLLTDEIDGLGKEIKPYMIDRFSLYQISRYNNEYVPNGKGGTERRFLKNLVINKEQDGWKAIDNILSSCFVRRYWNGGVLTFIQDRPDTIFAIVTNADIEGDFTRSSTDVDERATAVNVTWVDLNNFGKTRNEYVTDPYYVSQNGFNIKTVECVGCTRRSEAQRYGRAIIHSENLETEVITFKARQRFGSIPLGKVIAISDNFNTGVKLGGLITAATTSSITTDEPIQFFPYSGFDETFYITLYPEVREAIRNGTYTTAYDHYAQVGQAQGKYANGYLLLIELPDNTISIRRCVNNPGTTNIITIDGTFPSTPLKESTWLLLTPDTKPELYRIQGREPDEDNIDLFTITCTQYDEFKWEKIERKIVIEEKKDTPISVGVKAPDTINVSHYRNGQTINLEVSWNVPDQFVKRYIFGYNYASTWTEVEVLTNTYTLPVAATGTYIFRVAAVGFNDLTSVYYVSPSFFITLSQTIAISNNSYYSWFDYFV